MQDVMDINLLARQAMEDSRIALVDVRTEEEYREGHIPGSLLVELTRAYTILDVVRDHDTPLYVYCRSGRRSEQASILFRRLPYKKVRNIRGILSWNGPTVSGKEI